MNFNSMMQGSYSYIIKTKTIELFLLLKINV